MRRESAIYAVYILILGAIAFKAGWARSDLLLMLAGVASVPVACRIAKSKYIERRKSKVGCEGPSVHRYYQ